MWLQQVEGEDLDIVGTHNFFVKIFIEIYLIYSAVTSLRCTAKCFIYTYIVFFIIDYWASLVIQLVENSPAVQETWVHFLGWVDPLEKGRVTHSNILAWRMPWTCIVHGVTKSQR